MLFGQRFCRDFKLTELARRSAHTGKQKTMIFAVKSITKRVPFIVSVH